MQELQERNKNFEILVNPLLSCLIFDAEETILLKYMNKILINKYPFNNNEYYNLLLDYNKLYLGYRNNGEGIQFFQYYAIKSGNKSYVYHKTLPFHEKGKLFTQFMTRKETEELFDPLKYDSMYIMDVNGIIHYAYNKKDGYIINKTIIPSDKEIIDLDTKKRDINNKMVFILREKDKNYEQIFTRKKIEEIKDIKIFGGIIFTEYKVLLVTSKDNKFDVRWFSLHFLEKNKFKFNYAPILTTVPNQDDILSYIENNSPDENSNQNIKRILIK